MKQTKSHEYKLTFDEVRYRQALPIEIKEAMSRQRIRDFVNEYGEENIAVCYSGGIDSVFALAFARKYYPKIKAISVIGIECKQNIKLIQKTENVEIVPLKYSQQQIIDKFGYPVVSKKTAKAIQRLQNPSEKNKKSRELALTGITSQGRKASSYKLANKWRFLVEAPFQISAKCCYYMKETALQNYAKEKKHSTIVATIAEESKERMDGYARRGCTTFGELGYSTPFAFWTKQDILRWIVNEKIEISKAYGEVKEKDGVLYTTKADRTGCPICMFGMQYDKEPNRFQIMYYDDFRAWKKAIFLMDYKTVLDFFQKNTKGNYKYLPQEIEEMGDKNEILKILEKEEKPLTAEEARKIWNHVK